MPFHHIVLQFAIYRGCLWGNLFSYSANSKSYPSHGACPTEINAFKPAAKSYKRYDAAGLYIEVSPTGTKRWRFKCRYMAKYPPIDPKADYLDEWKAEAQVLPFKQAY